MANRILFEVQCINDFFDDAPGLLLLEVGESLCERIKALANGVTSLGAYTVTEFCYAGTWALLSSYEVVEALEEAGIECPDGKIPAASLSEDAWDLIKAKVDDKRRAVEVPQLCVLEDRFYFQSYCQAWKRRRIPGSPLNE